MARSAILDWTDAQVALKLGEHRNVKYRVFRDGETNFLEMRSVDDAPIHTLELPEGMTLDKGSYEVLLRYVLLDVVAA